MKSKFDVGKFFKPVIVAREIREEVARLRVDLADLDVFTPVITVADPKALTGFIVRPDVKALSLDLRESPAMEAAMGVVTQPDAASDDEDDEWEDEDDEDDEEDDDE